MQCGRRFTTYEKIELVPLLVVKKDKRREPFDSQKIRNGILHACEKRPVSLTEIDSIVTRIEQGVYNAMEAEVTTRQIGEMVMEELKKLDEVAYVRFASVYRQFTDISSFMEELTKLLSENQHRKEDNN
jgi:transcriptional repressor NrdR